MKNRGNSLTHGRDFVVSAQSNDAKGAKRRKLGG